jgi:hypothetical protein
MECVYCESQRIVEGKTMTSFTLNLDAIPLTDDQFYQLCQDNQDLRLELTSHGELIVMPPVGGESGKSEANFIIDVGTWNRRMRLGEVFSSSTVFKLPNGSQQSASATKVVRPMLPGSPPPVGKPSRQNSAASFRPLPLIL